MADNTIKTEELGDKLQQLFDSSRCAFYPEDDEILNLENQFEYKSVETNSTIILQHTFFLMILLSVALSISSWIYRYFYYIPALKYDIAGNSVNISPVATIWALTAILVSSMLFIAGVNRTPIYFVWGVGNIIIFMTLLFKIILTESSGTLGFPNLVSIVKLLSTNPSRVNYISFLVKIFTWIMLFIIGILSLVGIFKTTNTTAHMVFLFLLVLVAIFPVWLIYYSTDMMSIISRNM